MSSIARVVLAQMFWRCAEGAVAFVLLAALAGGCANTPVPSVLTPKSCPGDPCGSMGCPSGFTCEVNAQCAPRCQPLPLGNRSF